MANEACKFLLDVDKYFTNEIVDVTEFDNSGLFTYKCPRKASDYKCTTNNERINALGVYLYEKLGRTAKDFKGEGDNGNRHIEIFMLWLGDKLYKLENNYTTTLEESYKKHLEKYMPSFNYWNLIDSKRTYKGANAWYISELYSLLNCICKIINEYKKNPDSKEIGKISPQCYQKFKNIYDKVKECYSYFHLLKNLKNIYDGFKNAAIKNASTRNTPTYSPNNRFKMMALKYIMNASKVPLIDLTTSDWNTRFKDVSDRTVDFHTQPCVELRIKIEQYQEKHAPKVPPKATLTSGNKESGKEGNKKTADHPNPPKPAKPKNSDSSKQKGRLQKPNIRRKKQQARGSLPQALKQQQPLPPQQQQPPDLPQAHASPPIEPPIQTPPPQSQPAAPLSSHNDHPSKKPQTEGSNNSNESKDSGNGKENTGGASGNKGSQNGGSENPGDGLNGSTSSALGGSFDWGSSILKFLINGTEKLNKTSQFIQKNQQSFKDAVEKISGVYNDTVDNLKSAYNASSSHFNNIINNITSQFNKNDTPSKSGDKNPGPGKPVNGGNLPSQLPSPQTPSATDSTNLPLPPPKNTQPNSPKGPSINPPPSTPKDPSNPIQQKQLSSQPQPITQNPTQVKQPNPQKIGQLVESLSSNLNLKKPWNIFPTTWNGSGNCKSEIKLMNTTLVCCTSEQCSLTGISITFILIPIILLIAYKYLSREWTKKSEKKNMKRVIKLVDGNRKTQIIINSHDRSKHLKPVINSVDRKKDPLLNIYKLMQADPIPFINLFFLLIFFVYKRKSDFLEL
ncbi:PIR protein CIR protein [Plasmodium vinckei lentum]|uniref:PIR protein CIR protein n=1 Tax=Plasmodium vinckei lentum TaxID=138297 RepID=A0A6V7RTL2_PLAVN|nr:PIR protein CIR protein [Plasmodium vinckei lentum]